MLANEVKTKMHFILLKEISPQNRHISLSACESHVNFRYSLSVAYIPILSELNNNEIIIIII